MTCLAKSAATVQEEWTTLNRQLDAIKTKSGKKSDRVTRLEDEVASLNNRKDKLEAHLSDLFDGYIYSTVNS